MWLKENRIGGIPGAYIRKPGFTNWGIWEDLMPHALQTWQVSRSAIILIDFPNENPMVYELSCPWSDQGEGYLKLSVSWKIFDIKVMATGSHMYFTWNRDMSKGWRRHRWGCMGAPPSNHTWDTAPESWHHSNHKHLFGLLGTTYQTKTHRSQVAPSVKGGPCYLDMGCGSSEFPGSWVVTVAQSLTLISLSETANALVQGLELQQHRETGLTEMQY